MKLGLLFIVAVLAHSTLFAGVVNSGGGKAVVCYEDKSKRDLKVVKSLDLVEGEMLEGHTHAESLAAFEIQVEETIKKIPQDVPWREQLEIWSKEVIKGIKILPSGVSLKPVEDSHEVFLYDQNCEIQQLAHFLKVDSVMINGDLWAKMSNTQKAALVLHETAYYFTRSLGETDSKRARRVVSFLMSEDAQLISPIADIPKESYMCYGESVNVNSGAKKKTLLYVYKSGQGFHFSFLALNEKVKLSKYVLKLPIRNFPPWTGENLIHEGYLVDSNFEKEMSNLKIEFIRESMPIQFKISGDAAGYYGDSVEPVTVSCLPKFLTEKTDYYNFQLFEAIYIPALANVCPGDFNSRTIGHHTVVPVEFAYEVKDNESLSLDNLRIYVKDHLGNYQLMDVRNEDVDCLTKGNRTLNPKKNLFKNYLSFAIDPIVYKGENESNQTIIRDAVLVIRLMKRFADKSLDVIEYQFPFKIIKY